VTAIKKSGPIEGLTCGDWYNPSINGRVWRELYC